MDEPLNSLENSIGRSLRDVFDNEACNAYGKLAEHVVFSGEPYHDGEFKYDSALKGTAYWDLTLTPVKEASKVKYLIAAARDITGTVLSRRLLEEQLRTAQQKNRQFQTVFDNISDGLYIEDYENNIIFVNEATKVFFESIGISSENPALVKLSKCFDKDGREIPKAYLPITRIHRGEKYEQEVYTIRHENKDLHLSISGTPLYDSDNKLKMALLCVRNATDRINHEIELQHQRNLYYNVFDMLGLPIVYLSYPVLTLYGLNRNARSLITEIVKAYQLSYIEDAEIDRKFFLKLVSALEIDIRGLIKHFTEMECKKETVYYNFEVRKNRKKTVFKLVFKPITDIDNKIREVIITGIDITKEIEQKENMEKISRMKDEFVHTITHEFKTPLSVINSAIQAMEVLCRDEMSDKIKEYLRKIKQNSYRQLRLVNNLLDANKISNGKMRIHKSNIDIIHATKTITESVQLYAQHKGINLSFQSSADKKVIGVDDEKYERILLNLLSNAIKFTPKGKSAYVRTSLRSVDKRPWVCIEVEDEGIGIPEDKQDLIFERFGQVDSSFTRNAEGTGLGLSLVKQYVEALGGKISLRSEVGAGSTFTVLLPAVKARKDSPQTHMQVNIDNGLGQTVAVEFSDIYL
jgi:signal transduction histidine kinase/PAS domain-containing protein